jgi:hypothetical protein
MVTVRLQPVVQHMRGEVLESPGLRLTRGQIQRLWILDAEDCSAAVQKLLDARFLREERDGTFVRRFYQNSGGNRRFRVRTCVMSAADIPAAERIPDCSASGPRFEAGAQH